MTGENLQPISGVILAGGKSERMGRDKAFLELNGLPLIRHVMDTLNSLCTDLIIVTNKPESYIHFEARLVGDVYPGKGSLGGILSGLKAAREEYSLAVACDMPFLNQDLLRYMISLAAKYDVVIPLASSLSGKAPRGAPGINGSNTSSQLPTLPIAKERDLHPLHAIYSKRCLDPIEERIRADDLRMIGFHDAVRVRTVESAEVDRFDPEHWSFFNVNTPNDFRMANSRQR